MFRFALLIIVILPVCRLLWSADAPPAATRDLSNGGTLLLIGDSLFDCHSSEDRIEWVLKSLLVERAPGVDWKIFNEARGGEFIGPAESSAKNGSDALFRSEKAGRYFDVLKKVPRADAVIINYGTNDSKFFAPSRFRKQLEILCAQIEKDYPGALIVLTTSMYVDPKHSTRWDADDAKFVPGFKGNTRSDYLEFYNQEERQLAKEKGYRISDTYLKMKNETEKGNWDFRIRNGNGDPKDDDKHLNDMIWFSNIHPNNSGTLLVARTLSDVLLDRKQEGSRK